MRIRPLIALSVAAAAALLLAGCSGSGGSADPTPSASSSSACMLDAKSGADSDAIKVSGDAPAFEVTVPSELAFSDIQRTVVDKGDGKDLHQGDFVKGAYTIMDSTGAVLQKSEQTSADGSGYSPILLDAQSQSIFVAALECEPLGSTVAMTIPGSAFGEGASSVVIVAKATEELPLKADGADQDPVAGMPKVELAKNGEPTVTLPGGEPPTDLQLAVLKKGDGPVVNSGDTVYVQYSGTKWSDGSTFDSSWSRGAPAAFATTGVVEGFKQALEGQTVGSQVEVVIPPALGYGEGEINSSDLKGETLVFVVDILGVERAPVAAQ